MSESEPRPGPTWWYGPRRPAVRRAAVAALAGIVLLAGAWVAVRVWVDAGAAEAFLAERLSTGARDARVSVARAEAGLLRRRIRLETVSVAVAAPGPAAVPIVTADVEAVELDGVSLLDLLFGDRLDAGRLRLTRPVVTVVVGDVPSRPGDDGPDERREGDGTAGRQGPAGGAGGVPAAGLPDVEVDRLEVEDARVAVLGARAGGADRPAGWEDHLLEGLTLQLLDVSTEGRGPLSRPAEAGGVGGAEVALERYRGLLSGGMHGLELRGAAASLEGGSVEIDSLRVVPLPDDEGFLRRLEHRKDRIRLVAASVRGRGVDVRRLLGRSALSARRLDVGSLNVAVYSDKRLPPREGGPPPSMPPELVRRAAVPVAVDTVQVEDGRVEYSERTARASKPGRVSFEDLEASIYHVANDSSDVGPGRPAVVRTTSRLFGAGRLRADFTFPLRTPGLDFSVSGELGEMDLRSFNDMFVPVDGIRLESGRVETLRFEARVRDGAAIGSMHGRYRDLDIEAVDPESGGQSLPDLVKSIIVDARISSRNPPPEGEEPRVGEIRHRRGPEEPFFKFLWETVKSGLLSLVGA